MTEEHKIQFLKKTQLFSSLTEEELHRISRIMVVKRFKKNEIILCEDDTNKFMYIILDGRVKVIQTTEDGKETILAMHRSGDFFGEMSLIDGKTTPAMVMATEDSITAIISKNDFYSLIFGQNQNKVLEKLLQILCFRLRESWEKIQLLNFNNASQRMKMLFLRLSDEYGSKTTEGLTLNIRLTHQDMADMTGMARETVTRVIDKWQKNGEINVLKNKFIHLRTKFLQKLIPHSSPLSPSASINNLQ